MGGADIVPGVSGGTIAFITGIYDELLDSINAIKPSLLAELFRKGPAYVWNKINGNFLLALLLGIFTSILSLAKLIAYLIHNQPILLWSFFFGLILASSIYIAKDIKKWDIIHFMLLFLGIGFMVFISSIPPLSPSNSLIFLFLAGSLAICAMILPGISGSFILLVLGAYSTILKLISDLVEALPSLPLTIIIPLSVFGLGMIVGILSFSKLLKYLLDTQRTKVIALLTGLMVGSLWKLWPWKVTPFVYHKELGKMDILNLDEKTATLSVYLQNRSKEEFELLRPYIEENVLPNVYSNLNNQENAHIFGAILMMLLGVLVLFAIEKIASKSA